MRKLLVGTGALVGSWMFTIAMYGRLPDRVPTHWNIHFQPDAYGSPLYVLIIGSALLLLPIVAILVSRIDPRGGGRNRDPSTYWTMWNVLLVMLACLQLFIVASAAGWDVSSGRALPTLLGVLFIVMGNLEPRLRPNWFMGTRTPWTLSSDEVWRRTHRIGGRTMVLAGLLLVIGAWQPIEWMRIFVVIAALVLIAGVPIVYSYFAWRSLGRPSTPASGS